MNKTNVNSKSVEKDFLILAASFGLLTGLVEGLGLYALRQMGWLNWRLNNRAIWQETIWVAPIFDFVLFLLIGLVALAFAKLFPKWQIRKYAWYVFIALMVFDWAFGIAYGRLSVIALSVLALGAATQLAYYAVRSSAKPTQFAQRAFPWLMGLTLALLVLIQGGNWLNEKTKTANLPSSAASAPNVIVIVVDTLRADHLSGYGYSRNTSPFLDQLASEGVVYRNAISAASWTQPSHASMLTGRYTYEHHAETKPLDGTFPTIGEVMQSQGYRTGAFSGNTEFFTRRQGFGRGFLHFEDNYHKLGDFGFNTIYGFIFDHYLLRDVLKYEGTPGRRLASDVNRSLLSWAGKDTKHPFFAFINYFDVHDPYTPPEPYRNRYTTVKNPGGLINGYLERYHPSLTPEQLQSEIDAYDGSIAYVDDQIKNLFSELKQRGLLENTIVIITSDHGESLGEHGLLQHSASLYIQEIHVPLIVWAPGHIPAGTIINTPVSTTGISATVLVLIDSQNNPFPGPSLSNLIFDPNASKDWPQPISEVAQFTGAAEENPTTHGEMKSVFGIDAQYIVHEKFGDELYGWRVDPQETKNVATQPSMQNILNDFKLYLKNLIGDPIFKKP